MYLKISKKNLKTVILYSTFLLFSSIGIQLIVFPLFLINLVIDVFSGYTAAIPGYVDYVLYAIIPAILLYIPFYFIKKSTSVKQVFIFSLITFALINTYTFQNIILLQTPHLLLFIEIYSIFLAFVFSLIWKFAYIHQNKYSFIMLLLPFIPYIFFGIELLLSLLIHLIGGSYQSSLSDLLFDSYIVLGTFFINKTQFAFDLFYLDWGGYVLVSCNILTACAQLLLTAYMSSHKTKSHIT